jgi:hypothetical protein
MSDLTLSDIMPSKLTSSLCNQHLESQTVEFSSASIASCMDAREGCTKCTLHLVGLVQENAAGRAAQDS